MVPEGAYDKEFLAKVEGLGLKVNTIPAATAGGLRGTIAAVSVNPETGERMAMDTKGF